MKSTIRNAILSLMVLGGVVLAWFELKTDKTVARTQFSELYQQVSDDRVESISINAATGDTRGTYKNKEEFRSTVPPADGDFQKLLLDKGVNVRFEKNNGGGQWITILVNAIPFGLLLAIPVGMYIFFMRRWREFLDAIRARPRSS